jgi:sensor histidine kinase YesM
MLYEANERKIPLNKEVDYLQSYIDLQSLKLDKEVIINTKLRTAIDKPYAIEPMLLIPFIENAFKHGIGPGEHPMINIEMDLTGSTLFFMIRNTYTPSSVNNNMDAHGIGLLNVKRRLELIYKNKFTLDIEAKELFTVALKIDLG